MGIRIRIKEAGQTVPEKLDQTTVETYRNSNKPKTLTLREVFNLMAACDTPGKPDKRRKGPVPEGVLPETIEDVRNYLIARLPGLYADQIGGWPGTAHQFLLDENLSKMAASALWKTFGRATHTSYENLNGKKDPDVWKWAVRSDISAIVTRDRRMSSDQDLGLIAVRHSFDMIKKRGAPPKVPPPLVIQIVAPSMKSVVKIMAQHREEILRHLQKQTSPYIVLTETRCLSGPSFSDLALYKWETVQKVMDDIKYASTHPHTGPSASPS